MKDKPMVSLKRQLFAGLMMILVGGLLTVAALSWVERHRERPGSAATLQTASSEEPAVGAEIAGAEADSIDNQTQVSRP